MEGKENGSHQLLDFSGLSFLMQSEEISTQETQEETRCYEGAEPLSMGRDTAVCRSLNSMDQLSKCLGSVHNLDSLGEPAGVC
jgi:hypothetical protein